MQNYFDSRQLLQLIWSWKIHLSAVALLTISLVALFTTPHFVTPKYKSEARVYPINIESYSNESESEQMLEIMRSMDIKQKMFDHFKLMSYYGIDLNEEFALSLLIKEFNKNVTIRKTEFETVSIQVLDRDPKKACEMVNMMVSFYDQKLKNLHAAKYKEQLLEAKEELAIRKSDLVNNRKELSQIRTKYGIVNYQLQSEELSKSYAEALAANNQRVAKQIKQQIDRLGSVGSQFEALLANQNSLNESIVSLKIEHDKAAVKLKHHISYVQVVEKPYVADKKTYPIRWLITLVTLFIAEFLALLILLIIHHNKPNP